MSRPPRPARSSPFSRANVLEGVAQGLGLATILMIGYALLRAAGAVAEQNRSAVFISLVISVLLLTLANRSRWRPLLAGFTSGNPWLGRMTIAVAVTLALAIFISPLRRILGLAPPGASSMLTAVVMCVLGLAWLEALRWAMRWRRAGALLR